MSKCTNCGANFVGAPESMPPDGLCRYCQIDALKKERDTLRSQLQVAKSALRSCTTETHRKSIDDQSGILEAELVEYRFDKALVREALFQLSGGNDAGSNPPTKGQHDDGTHAPPR